MNKYILSCCSTADLSKEQFESRGISYICFHYELDGVSYSDDLGQSMDFKDFYHRMATGSSTKTSQVNAEEYEAYFRKFLEQGLDILHLTLSSGKGRSMHITLTDLGKNLLERTIYPVMQMEGEAFHCMTDEECQQMLALFGKYIQALGDAAKNLSIQSEEP